MDEFNFTVDDLKNYPHFDAPLSLREIKKLVTNPNRVAANGFYPFLLYHDEWQPYRTADLVKPERKSRPIRYGARRDAYIYKHYRTKLSKLYEARLVELGIADCPIAYRQIPKPGQSSGKCNIDFAKDAFDEIDRLGDCVAVALDIKSYFESLDHSRIKRTWCDLLGVRELPADHYAVYKNITRYSFVDQQAAYSRLGYFGVNERNGEIAGGFEIPYREMPKQLCTPEDFRAKICGLDPAYSSLIRKNTEHFGVPQGAPISDLIANFYLLKFDQVMHDYACQLGGRYMRYSDDILVIVPGGEQQADAAARFAVDEIRNHGSQLQIKESKTCISQFLRNGEMLTCRHVRRCSDARTKNGLEYLGFQYDGRKVYVRASTVSSFYRRVSSAAKLEGARHVANNLALSAEDLIASFNYSLFSQRFSKVKREYLTDDYRSWTFYSYLKRSSETFGAKGDRIFRQARRFKTIMRSRVERAIVRNFVRKSGMRTEVG